METCQASLMNFDGPSPGPNRASGQVPDGGRLDRYAEAEDQLDRRENAERCEDDIRELDFSVFLLLGIAVLILLGVVVLVVL